MARPSPPRPSPLREVEPSPGTGLGRSMPTTAPRDDLAPIGSGTRHEPNCGRAPGRLDARRPQASTAGSRPSTETDIQHRRGMADIMSEIPSTMTASVLRGVGDIVLEERPVPKCARRSTGQGQQRRESPARRRLPQARADRRLRRQRPSVLAMRSAGRSWPRLRGGLPPGGAARRHRTTAAMPYLRVLPLRCVQPLPEHGVLRAPPSTVPSARTW